MIFPKHLHCTLGAADTLWAPLMTSSCVNDKVLFLSSCAGEPELAVAIHCIRRPIIVYREVLPPSKHRHLPSNNALMEMHGLHTREALHLRPFLACIASASGIT